MPVNLNISYASIFPEIILTLTAVIILLVSAFLKPRKGSIFYTLFGPVTVSLLGIGISLAYVLSMPLGSATEPFFAGSFAQDGYALFFKIVFLLASFLVIILSVDYVQKKMTNAGELYALLIAATTAMCFMTSATDLVTLYISIEFLSLMSFVLAGYLKTEPRSNEASLKYFLYGSVCSAVMLYGFSLIYGLTGSTSYASIASQLGGAGHSIVLMSLVLVTVGLGFKIAMVPFHQWSPDTYEGAPTPVTAFLSVAPKAAGFAVLIRMFTGIFPTAITHWTGIIGICAALTMTLGNLTAIPQTSAKRMLAYSSIAQAGYVLVGLAAWIPGSDWAMPGMLVYLFTYVFMNLGAFAVVLAIENCTGSEEINSYAGMWRRCPWLAGAMTFFMLSLAGIPPTAGFVGKFLVFGAAINSASAKSWLGWLAGIGIVNSVISLYYYFNVVRIMFFIKSDEEKPIQLTPSIRWAVGITLVGTLAIIFLMGPVFGMAQSAVAFAFR